jgi:hypothetical protein
MEIRRFEGREESGTRIFVWSIVFVVSLITTLCYFDYTRTQKARIKAEGFAKELALELRPRVSGIIVNGGSNIVISNNIIVPAKNSKAIYLTNARGVTITGNSVTYIK